MGAIRRIADQLGIHPEALRTWVKRAETDAGERPGTTSGDAPASQTHANTRIDPLPTGTETDQFHIGQFRPSTPCSSAPGSRLIAAGAGLGSW
jgi:hypothetical protein